MSVTTRQCISAWLLTVLGCQGASAAQAGLSSEDAELREIFSTIIGMKTSEGLGQVPTMARYLAGLFAAAGFPAADIQFVPLGETGSLIVRYRGDGNGGRPIDFMGHMDVVTANREDWQRDPFTLIEENGYFFGRGTLDIKQEDAEMTAAFLRLKRAGFKPTRDLILVLTGDEERGGLTVQDLLANHRELIDAEFALNSDAGDGILNEKTGAAEAFFVSGAEKSYEDFELTIRNPGGHSAYPEPSNAIYELADALKRIQAYRFPVMWNEWTLGNIKAVSKVTPGPLGKALAQFAANPQDKSAADVLYLNPAYIGKTRTTCVPTLLKGGHAPNALPQMAQVTINCRVFPGTSPDAIRATLQELAGQKTEINWIKKGPVSPASPMNKRLWEAIVTAVHAVHPDIPIVPEQVSYGSDGAYFNSAGIPSYGVMASFFKESEVRSHGLNETVPVASLYQGAAQWKALIIALAGH